jgi:hypothetical protein
MPEEDIVFFFCNILLEGLIKMNRTIIQNIGTLTKVRTDISQLLIGRVLAVSFI